MAEDVAATIRLGEQHVVVDGLAEAVEQLRLLHAGDRGQHRLGDARAGRGGDTEDPLGAAAEPHDPGQQHLLEACREFAWAGDVAGTAEDQLLGEEGVGAVACCVCGCQHPSATIASTVAVAGYG